MSKIKEAIELLENGKLLNVSLSIKIYYCRENSGPCFVIKQENYNKALALLRSLVEEPKCKTCNDTEQVGEETVKYGRSMGFRECPDCQAEEPEAGEPRVIFLSQGQFAIVDAEDYEKLKQYKWHAVYKDGWYARRITSWAEGHKTIWMHREIMKPPDDMQIDHRNHNGFDNRRCNLRTCTQSDNQHNQRPRKNTSSKYKGVSWRKNCSKWHACIRHDGKLINLGDFEIEEEAAKTYNKKAIELFGEYACLNQIPKTT